MVRCLLKMGCQPGAAVWAHGGLAVEKLFIPLGSPALTIAWLNTVLREG